MSRGEGVRVSSAPGGTLEERLRARLRGQTVVVGIGNPHRGDDAAGSLVARRLRQCLVGGSRSRLRVIDAEDIPEAFLGPITRPRPDTVVLVDAVNLGAEPGTAALLEVEDVAGREVFTHNASLTLLARYVRAQTAADVFLLGIQPGSRGTGEPPGREVADTAALLALLLGRLGSATASDALEVGREVKGGCKVGYRGGLRWAGPLPEEARPC